MTKAYGTAKSFISWLEEKREKRKELTSQHLLQGHTTSD
jgi:hypothetical protein